MKVRKLANFFARSGCPDRVSSPMSGSWSLGVVERCVGKPNGPDWVSGIEIV